MQNLNEYLITLTLAEANGTHSYWYLNMKSENGETTQPHWVDQRDFENFEPSVFRVGPIVHKAVLEHPYIPMRSKTRAFKYLSLSDEFKIYSTEYEQYWRSQDTTMHDAASIKNAKTMAKISKLFQTLKPEEIQIAKKYIESL